MYPDSGLGPIFLSLILANWSAIRILLNLLTPSRLNASSAFQHRSAHFFR